MSTASAFFFIALKRLWSCLCVPCSSSSSESDFSWPHSAVFQSMSSSPSALRFCRSVWSKAWISSRTLRWAFSFSLRFFSSAAMRASSASRARRSASALALAASTASWCTLLSDTSWTSSDFCASSTTGRDLMKSRTGLWPRRLHIHLASAPRSRSRRDDIIVARPDAHVVGSHLPTSTSSLNSVR